jgi:hypothetical protein
MARQNADSATDQTTKKSPVMIGIDPNPKGEWKALAGADHDEWNNRQGTLVLEALACKKTKETTTAVITGMIDMKPADPIEGMLIGQLIAVNEASMSFYRLGWLNVGEHFEAGTKFLQLADKASRTVAMLTERLDQHRNRGQQQITVKRLTVNADQAVVTDQIISNKGNGALATALLSAGSDKSMEIIEQTQKAAVPVGGGGKDK